MNSAHGDSSGVKFDYRGARVLVTGGTSGIGAAAALAYRSAGAEVVVTGTRKGPEDYDSDLTQYQYMQLDVTNTVQLARVATALPHLDILIHSGGVALASLGKDEYEPDFFEEAVRMHLTSVYRLSRLCKEKLAASRLPAGGCIVGIASMSSYFGIGMVPGYGAAKAGLVQLMKTLAVEWAKDRIRANAVAAGLIATRQTAGLVDNPEFTAATIARTPLGRMGRADEVANALLFLTSGAASYITGQTLAVDGGFSIFGG